MWTEMLRSFPLSVKASNLHRKKVKEVQQTVFEKRADSFKPAWLTLPDSFQIPQNPCQTVLNFFGFLFTPETESYSCRVHNNHSRKNKWWVYIVNISDLLVEEYFPQNLLRIFCFSNLSWLKYISERNIGMDGFLITPDKKRFESVRLNIIRLRWILFVIPARHFSVKAFRQSKYFGTQLKLKHVGSNLGELQIRVVIKQHLYNRGKFWGRWRPAT